MPRAVFVAGALLSFVVGLLVLWIDNVYVFKALALFGLGYMLNDLFTRIFNRR